METYISHATELNSECNYIHFLREDGKYETDLSALEDSLHCTYENSYNCSPNYSRGHSISGPDPYSPWYNLGYDTGFEMIRLPEPYIVDGDTFSYMFEDDNIVYQSILRFEFDNYGILISKDFLTEDNFAKIDFSNNKTRVVTDNYTITDQIYETFMRNQ